MVTPLEIAGRRIGPDEPCFVIAEAGVNHGGDLDLARRLVDAAAEAGADAVKFQTFAADELATPQAPKAAYQMRTTDARETQLDMLRRLQLSREAHHALIAHCAERGILFLSSVFDEGSAELLEELGVPAFKIPSGELTNPALLCRLAAKGRPVILSTGMATLDEVSAAVATLGGGRCPPVVLLHCVSSYPADPSDVNLRAMSTMQASFGVPVGYSDHTLGLAIALAAVTLGACVLEKHLTLDRRLPGPDHAASLEPNEFAVLVRSLRSVEGALGHGRKEPSVHEVEIARTVRKSLVAARDIPAGTKLTEELVVVRRPGTGLPPSVRADILGWTTTRGLAAGTPIQLEHLVAVAPAETRAHTYHC